MNQPSARRLTFTILLLSWIPAGCSDPDSEVRYRTDTMLDPIVVDVSGTVLAPYRERLIDVAFESVSKMPLEPHVKNRSRAQEAVVETCFELDQPERALRYVEEIENWRRGGGFADYVFHCARNGVEVDAERYLSLASEVASTDESARSQAWRGDQIRAKIARAWLLVGNPVEAARWAGGLSASEAGRVQVADAMVVDPELFDARLDAVRTIVAGGHFDQTRGMLEACAELFDRFHDDPARRARTLETIRASWEKLPTSARVELAFDLAERALRHADPTEALALVDEAQLMVDGTQWTHEELIPLRARLARLRFLAGDGQRAITDLDAALASYEAERERITDIYRAGALRPVAEAYAATGNAQTALEVYRKAVVAGFLNPNARPRAEDLSATLCSMAENEIEPDGALWERIAKIQAALGDPW